MNSKYYKAVKTIQLEQEPTEIKVSTLKGDFYSTQVQNFFKRYELLEYYPYFDEKNNKQTKGFHACLFKKKKNTKIYLGMKE